MTSASPRSQPSVAVVVCAYTMKRWDDIVDAYESLVQQTRPADEVVLVIDHNDELLATFSQAYPLAHVVANTGPQGLSGARNTGIAATSSEVVLFLDDDAKADADWLERLIEPFSEAGVVGVAGWADPSWATPGRPGWFPEEFLWVVGCSYRGLPEQRADIRNPIGCNMGFRREAMVYVGGFSDGIGRVGAHPLGCEETELSIRIRQANRGARIVLEPAALIHHRVTGNRLTFRYFTSRCYWEGVSKAVVAKLVGPSDALSSERSYATKVLPSAVGRGLLDGLRGDIKGPLRAATVVVGLALTTFGYLRGSLSRAKPAGDTQTLSTAEAA